MHKLSITALMIALLLLSACNPAGTPGAESDIQLTQPLATLSPLAAQTPITAVALQYTDSRIGFTFSYPDGWTLIAPADVTDAVAYSYTIQSFEPTTGGGEGFPDDETKIDILVNASETVDSLDSIRERLSQDEASGNLTIEHEERVTLEGGIEALVIHGTGFQGGEFVGIYTIINGHEVGMTGFGDEQAIMQVANSLLIT